MAQALPAAHWLMKLATKASPSTSSDASSTRCPSDSHSAAAERAAATQSGCTSLPLGESVKTAMRSVEGAAAAAAAKDGPRSGGAAYGSPGTGPAVASRMAALSRTERVTTCSHTRPPIRSP